jgi:HD-GYP domain-containing protein (c-di-GMP phosphodiesterase class II)
VADVVEAMVSHRPYRPAKGLDNALEEILKNRGTLYDPDIVDACVRLFSEKGFQFKESSSACHHEGLFNHVITRSAATW